MTYTWIERDKANILNVYKRLPLVIERGEGSYLIDRNQDRYLDFMTGISVNNFGYDSGLVETMTKQMQYYLHLSNSFISEPAVELAGNLIQHTMAKKIFYTNSGTEATEAALKMVRKYGNQRGRSKIYTAAGSFHGRTMGSLALTGQVKYQNPFAPMLESVDYFEYNNEKDIEEKLNGEVAAVFIEMVQGEGGVKIMTAGFLEKLVELSKKHGFLIVVDEAQTGMGRCGKLFAYQAYGFEPDLVTTAKFLGGGLPLGAVLVGEKLEYILEKGEHGSTFGGNPVACAGGNYVIKQLLESAFQVELQGKSNYLLQKLAGVQNLYPEIIQEIRGMGMMIGLECGVYAEPIKALALEEKLILNVTHQTVIRLLPSLKISYEEIDFFIEKLESAIKKLGLC